MEARKREIGGSEVFEEGCDRVSWVSGQHHVVVASHCRHVAQMQPIVGMWSRGTAVFK